MKITKLEENRRRRLRGLLADRDKFKTQAAFAVAAGHASSYITQIKTGTRPFNEKTARDIEATIGLPEGWFDELESEVNVSETNIIPNIRPVPLISWVKAGQFCESPDDFEPDDAEAWIPVRPKGASDKSYALRVDGDSMTSPYPGKESYPDGWIIIVDPEQEVLPGMAGIFKQPSSNTSTFKELASDDGKLYLKPLNPQFPIIEVKEGMTTCGRVVGLYKDI